MKILALTSLRGLRPATIQDFVEDLGLDDDDELALVSWHTASEPLPLLTHVAIGPRPLISMSRLVPGDPATVPPHWTWGGTLGATPAGSVGDEEATTTGDAGLDSGPTASEPVPAAPASGLRAALTDPAALKRALLWRVRKLKRGPGRKIIAALPGRLQDTFALAALRSPHVRTLFADADVVVSMDVHTHRAAWLLARRHSGPAVQAGAPGGRVAIAERRAAVDR